MIITDEQPFLDAIFARYHHDAPRLVYADFLEEAGDPERAELVRVQIALAHLSNDHPRRPELANRQAELLATHAARWTDHLKHLVAGVEYRRGVPDSVSMYAGAFLSDGEELFRLARVCRLRLLEAARVMPKLIHCPLLGRVQELDLCGNDLGNGGVNLLSRSPFLKDLRVLDLGFNGADDVGVWALSRSAGFPNLAVLMLNDNGHITAQGVKSLVESPFFTGLQELDIAGNDISDGGIRAIATGRAFPHLHTLRLKGNHIGDEGAAILAHSALLVRMLQHTPRLELRENAIGPAGAVALASSPLLARCETLDLSGNYLADRGFAALAASPYFGRLHTLRIGGNQITDAGVAAARNALPALMARLRLLDLSGNRLTRHGIGMFHAARGDSGVVLDVSANVQTLSAGEAPVMVGQVVTGVLEEVAEAAELRRRITHPRTRSTPDERPPG